MNLQFNGLEPGITSAMRALVEAAPQAQSDPNRPVYHFLPPARWMNDINGPLYHKGEYHVFYQHNPFGDKPYDDTIRERVQWARMHWGHARSRDMVSWEHMPIALAPSGERGEASCWSGCAAVNGKGRPMLFYTAVFETELPYKIPFEQWAAVGDEELMGWKRSSANPILALKTHGGPDFNTDWRDPFIFNANGRTFMIIGACGEAGTPIYEAHNDELTEWAYRGVMWDRSVECPNFVALGDTWAFISSPFDLVSYDIGSFDIDTLRFTPATSGTVDYGHFYGTNTVFDGRGRCVLFGWIPGWDWDQHKDGRAWNGCMSVPRIVSLGPDRRLVQTPLPELERLRMHDTHFHRSDMRVADSAQAIERVRGDTSEIIAEFSVGDAAACGLNVRASDDGTRAVAIHYDAGEKSLDVAGAHVPLHDGRSRETMKLRAFLDKCVMEVFINDGEAVATRMISAEPDDVGVEVFARGGTAHVKSIDIWEMSRAIPTAMY